MLQNVNSCVIIIKVIDFVEVKQVNALEIIIGILVIIVSLIIIAVSIYKFIVELHGDNIAIKIVDGVLICATIICSFAYVIDRICMQKSITWEDIFLKSIKRLVIWLKNNKCKVICYSIFLILFLIVIYLLIRKSN